MSFYQVVQSHWRYKRHQIKLSWAKSPETEPQNTCSSFTFPSSVFLPWLLTMINTWKGSAFSSRCPALCSLQFSRGAHWPGFYFGILPVVLCKLSLTIYVLSIRKTKTAQSLFSWFQTGQEAFATFSDPWLKLTKWIFMDYSMILWEK